MRHSSSWGSLSGSLQCLSARRYEILSDETKRKDYDYALEHPEEVFYNNMRMYQHTYAPKTDLRWVLLGVRRPPLPHDLPLPLLSSHTSIARRSSRVPTPGRAISPSSSSSAWQCGGALSEVLIGPLALCA